MNQDKKAMINDYIKQCDKVLSTKDYNQAKELEKDITSVFFSEILNIKYGLDRHYGINQTSMIDYLGNIKKLEQKLKLHLTNIEALTNNKESNLNTTFINNNVVSDSGNSTNNNSNTLTNIFDIKVELEKVKQIIEDDEILSEDDKEEINLKLQQLDDIINNNNTNNDKWKKSKEIITWVTTKGYKIGSLVMPLITKVLFPDAN